MSFILDALKKSESDRQRQSGPALFEVRVAPPRNSLPLWAIGLAVLLGVNLVIVAWVLLRRPAAPEQTAPTAASQTFAQPGQGPTMGQVPPGANTAYPGPQQTFTGPPATTVTVPVGGTAPGAPVGQTAGMTQSSQPTQPAGTTAPSNTMSAASDASGTAPESTNPDDYAPAADPPAMPGFANRVTRTTSTGVPLYQDAALTTHLPNLHLDLHVFAANPQQRFVMINTRKLREGESLPEGVIVESITPEGAVLSHNGTRFLLPRD
jgi:general secretion pathway protein B